MIDLLVVVIFVSGKAGYIQSVRTTCLQISSGKFRQGDAVLLQVRKFCPSCIMLKGQGHDFRIGYKWYVWIDLNSHRVRQLFKIC
jgi:hypothetical protein